MKNAKATYDFGDRLGRFFEHNGLPRMAGRIMGHLLVCVPAEQTFDEIVSAAGASRSSVSVATQFLIRIGIVERFGVPDDRRDRYRLRDGAWTSMLQQDIAAARELRELAEDGLGLMKGQPRAGSARLLAMREFYTFLETSLTPLLTQWQNKRRPR